MDNHSTDTQCDRWFTAQHADLWATIDCIRRHRDHDTSTMTDEELLDALGYEGKKMQKIASLIRSRR